MLTRASVVLALLASTATAACGGIADTGVSGSTTDASRSDVTVGGGTQNPPGNDAGHGSPKDAFAPPPSGDAVASLDSGPVSTIDGGATGAGPTEAGPLDAGIYYGDGSFFVDAGAYPDAGTVAHGEVDASAFDAAPGCGPLAACCATLSGSTQAVCTTIVASASATECATELAQLQGAEECTGVSVLASQVQVLPNRIVSDGTNLFWTTFEQSPSLLSMPVSGGPIKVLVSPPGSINHFLSVDGVNVYIMSNDSLVRIPKNGAAPSLVNEPGAVVTAATTLGGTAYWLESTSAPGPGATSVVARRAPLIAGTSEILATFATSLAPDVLGVTSTAAIFGQEASSMSVLPLATGVPSGGPAMLDEACVSLTSDVNAVYCNVVSGGSNLVIASDGTTTPLGAQVNSSLIVFDDTYAYWVDDTTVGTILRAPKAGGGTATIVARDSSPNAIAVDANAIYWSDAAGYIKSLPKNALP